MTNNTVLRVGGGPVVWTVGGRGGEKSKILRGVFLILTKSCNIAAKWGSQRELLFKLAIPPFHRNTRLRGRK